MIANLMTGLADGTGEIRARSRAVADEKEAGLGPMAMQDIE
jgi:hypothetical protein